MNPCTAMVLLEVSDVGIKCRRSVLKARVWFPTKSSLGCSSPTGTARRTCQKWTRTPRYTHISHLLDQPGELIVDVLPVADKQYYDAI